MIHHCQRLPLRFETGDDLAAVHAGLDHLEGDAAADRLKLLGHIDHAKATFADLLEELVGADLPAEALENNVGRRRRISRRFQKTLGIVVSPEQTLDAGTQVAVGRTSLVDIAGAGFPGRNRKGLGKNLLDGGDNGHSCALIERELPIVRELSAKCVTAARSFCK